MDYTRNTLQDYLQKISISFKSIFGGVGKEEEEEELIVRVYFVILISYNYYDL